MQPNGKHIVEVLLPIKSDKTFAYETSEPLKEGQLVLVPFRNKNLNGVVFNTETSFTKESIREIISKYNYFLHHTFLSFLKAAAEYNIIELGIIFKMSNSAFNQRKIIPSHYTADSFSNITLSKEQTEAFEILLKHSKSSLISVIEGVTSSGKTLLYLKLIEELLKTGGQALILLPEIALTTQIMERFIKLMPTTNILQWHSGLTPKKKQDLWQQAINGNNLIVIGARSSLFLPFTNLKVIIVDEEHDSSFKQEEGAIYNARDMSVLRGKIEKIPVILSSATPSMETIYNCKIGKYKKIEMISRFGGVLLPSIQIIDMTLEKLPKDHFISNQLKSSLIDTINNSKQALLFLNRKGYAPLTLCSECGTKVSCKNCSSYLVFHKKNSLLLCHYCGYKTNIAKECSNCHSKKMIFFGPGIEKIEEELMKILPSARIAIATSETITNQKSASKLIAKISNHEIDILIGTQILAKGLDFKLLQLVGVIDADCSYTSGDIRVNERMYQLLSQVSGRAGRDKERGQVLLQTYEPHNHILHSIINNNQKAFLSAELNDREISNTPPFSRIAIISILCKKESKLIEFTYEMSDVMPTLKNLIIFGPSPAPISFLKGNYRYRFIIKAQKNINIQKMIKQWLDHLTIPHSIKIKIDIDPYNFN